MNGLRIAGLSRQAGISIDHKLLGEEGFTGNLPMHDRSAGDLLNSVGIMIGIAEDAQAKVVRVIGFRIGGRGR